MKRLKEMIDDAIVTCIVSIIKCVVGAFILLLLVDTLKDCLVDVPKLEVSYWEAFKALIFTDCLVNLLFTKTKSKND